MTKRDIKFRGFIHKCNEMVPFDELKQLSTPFSAFEDDESIVFEQYTGLKDVNGVEIYEGDIVQYKDSDHKFTVEWHNGSFWCIPVGWVGSTHTLYKRFEDHPNILGNIHENPELLEVF